MVAHAVNDVNGKVLRTASVSASVKQDYNLIITIKDSGPGFDPRRIPNPTAAPNLLANHGRGIFLMRQLMDQVDFTFNHGTHAKTRQWLE